MRHDPRRLNSFIDILKQEIENEKIYKLAKNRERRSRDTDHMRCIKDDDGRLLVISLKISMIDKESRIDL